jgi:hypothetical protein
VPALEVKTKPDEGKDAKEKETKPQPRGTIVKIGTAEFSVAEHPK